VLEHPLKSTVGKTCVMLRRHRLAGIVCSMARLSIRLPISRVQQEKGLEIQTFDLMVSLATVEDFANNGTVERRDAYGSAWL